MCRWGCTTTDTTYMCKWCGTRYCKACLLGDFHGKMSDEAKCRVCFQARSQHEAEEAVASSLLRARCQGVRVEYVPRKNPPDEDGGKRGKSARGKSAKRGTSAKRGKSGKKSGKKRKK